LIRNLQYPCPNSSTRQVRHYIEREKEKEKSNYFKKNEEKTVYRAAGQKGIPVNKHRRVQLSVNCNLRISIDLKSEAYYILSLFRYRY